MEIANLAVPEEWIRSYVGWRVEIKSNTFDASANFLAPAVINSRIGAARRRTSRYTQRAIIAPPIGEFGRSQRSESLRSIAWLRRSPQKSRTMVTRSSIKWNVVSSSKSLNQPGHLLPTILSQILVRFSFLPLCNIGASEHWFAQVLGPSKIRGGTSCSNANLRIFETCRASEILCPERCLRAGCTEGFEARHEGTFIALSDRRGRIL